MRLQSHFSFGVALAAVVYVITQSLTYAFLALFVQVGLILDFICKKFFHVEPFHSVLGMIVVCAAFYWFDPAWGVICLISYGTHLLLDLVVDEPLAYFFPFSSKHYCFPKKGVEDITINASIFIALLLFVIIAYGL